jgi:hypothetical protein
MLLTDVAEIFGVLWFGFVLALGHGFELVHLLPARRRVAATQADARPGHDDVTGRTRTAVAAMAIHHRSFGLKVIIAILQLQ